MLENIEEIGRLKGSSLVEQIYEALLEQIVAGKIPRGTILSEVGVARELDVSRTPVHDALRQLAKDGLVERVVGRRARVAPFSKEDVFEIFEMRILLEPEAAALSAGRMDFPKLAMLEDSLKELREGIGRPDWKELWAKHDGVFHRTISEESGRKRLAHDIGRYRLLHRGLNLLGVADDLKGAMDEHSRILAAIKDRDAGRAGEEMVNHLRIWQDYFVRAFPI